MKFEEWVYEQGYVIVLTDLCIDQIRAEEGGSHDDGSDHEYEPALTPDGLVDKCPFCGEQKAREG
jgi:hypothetical protein